MIFKKKSNNVIKNKNVKSNSELYYMIEELKKLTQKLDTKEHLIKTIQEDYKNIFKMFVDIIVIIDKEGTVIDLNPIASSLLYNSNESFIGKKWKNIIENLGCNWNNSIEKKILDENSYDNLSKEIYIKVLRKHYIINIIPVVNENKMEYFVFTAKDITAIKIREIELIQKSNLITHITNISEVFTQNFNIDHILNKIVENLSRIDNIDRCSIYRNCTLNNNILYGEKIKKWHNYDIEIPKISLNKIFYKGVFKKWLTYFELNHILCGNLDTFSINEQKILRKRNIKTLCIVPIFSPIGNWGFLTFESCKNEKKWTYDEERVLKIVGNIIGAGIYQWFLRNNEKETINKSCVNF